MRGDDRRNWSQQFGIKHYAGQVIYKVDGFLNKSKDVQQDQLFDLMSGSKNVFIKDLVQFQVKKSLNNFSKQTTITIF